MIRGQSGDVHQHARATGAATSVTRCPGDLDHGRRLVADYAESVDAGCRLVTPGHRIGAPGGPGAGDFEGGSYPKQVLTSLPGRSLALRQSSRRAAAADA